MEKSSWKVSIIIVALIILATFAYFYYNKTRCGYYNEDTCDKSCISDDDCQPFIGSCININEKPYLPETLSVAYADVNCSCANQICVGKPTGELAI